MHTNASFELSTASHCSVRTFPLKKCHRAKIREGILLTPDELGVSFRSPKERAKFDRNLLLYERLERARRPTDRDRTDLVICVVLCYDCYDNATCR